MHDGSIFSYSKCTEEDPFYHVYEVNADGTNLRQLTEGEYEDLMPNYLPDGGIVFTSTRRKGHARCFGAQFGPRWHVYTLHRMDADGSNIRTLSFHETNEWFPTVAPSGHILYSRWDYVDRHPVVHQNLWACRPDGTNPVAVWGNHTETPHCTFQLQPIPNTTKIVFTASAHHSITGGSVAIVTPHRGNNGEQALDRITPDVKFPEAEGRLDEYYDAPWPLSEDTFLVGYSPKPLLMEPQANDPAALGIYLLDRRGNRELIYRDPAIGSSHPIPLVPRPVPPILPSTLPSDAPPTGELVMADVYQGLGNDVPARQHQGVAHHPGSAQDHAGGRRAARRAGRSGADAGGPGHRTGRAGRVGAVCGSGAQADPVPGVGPGRAGLSDDAFDHLSAARRDEHLHRLPRAPQRRAGQQDDPSPAAAAVADRARSRRHAAFLVRPPDAADPGSALRALPRRREGGERHRLDGHGSGGLHQVLLGAVRQVGLRGRGQGAGGIVRSPVRRLELDASDHARRRVRREAAA